MHSTTRVHSITTVILNNNYTITTPSTEGSPRALRDGGVGTAPRALRDDTGRGGGHGRALRANIIFNILILPQSRLYASQSDPEQPLMEKQIAAKNYYYVGCKSGMGISYSSTPPKESVYLPI